MLDPQKADAVCSGGGGPLCGLREGDVHLDERAGDHGGRRRYCDCCRRCRGRRLNRSFVDGALLPVDGDDLPVLQNLRRFLGPDDCRRPELPAHDGRMAGHTTFVGYDGLDPAHRRHHIGVGHLGDQDIAILDSARVPDVPDDHDPAARYPGRSALAFQQHHAERGRGFQCGFCTGTGDLRPPDGRDGAGLENEDLVADDRPLDILRDAVVLLRDLSERCEARHLLVREDRGGALFGSEFDDLCPVLALRHDHDLLLGDQAVDHAL